MVMTPVPDERIRDGNRGSVNPGGRYVLYWMTAYRRLGWNFALQRAAEEARRLGLPLVILEALRVDYPHASPRLHQFILQGMAERAEALRGSPVLHLPFVEREPGEGRGLLKTLSSGAGAVVTDEFPSFFLPGMVRAAGEVLDLRFEVVDSNGLLPLRDPDRVFSAAYHFRRYLQKRLPEYLGEAPAEEPLQGLLQASEEHLPEGFREVWPAPPAELLAGKTGALAGLPLLAPATHTTGAVGTSRAAGELLRAFLDGKLQRYHEDRNHPDLDGVSGLSPYLHFGLISAHQVFQELVRSEGWTPLRLSDRTDGARAGWWGMGQGAEAFLDQLLTWRELGFNMTSRRKDYAEYASLPAWARQTLAEHAGDPRPWVYSLEEFRAAATHDPLWNAAQRQLLEEGMIHNYLRMLWGKKILEWSESPRRALEIMLELNDGLALDGRDPNSYSGISWCLGRYDRGWPERPVFGKVRSMTSGSTRRKIKLDRYLERFSSDGV